MPERRGTRLRSGMQSDASTSPRRRSTSCYSDSGDSSCSEPFSECGSDDLSFTPAAAAGIHRLLLSCAAEASEDAISSLMAELESPAPSLDSLRRAAMELRLLAKHNPDNRVRIAKAGGVRPLVKLLSHADPLLQEHGVTALLNLSLCDENKATIVEAGAIRPLVQALKSAASPAARENAACALLRLSQLDGAAAAAIGRAGAIPLLVSLLETGGPRGKKDAATAIFNLVLTPQNKARATQAGIVPALLRVMDDRGLGMVDEALSIFLLLSSHAACRAEIGTTAFVEKLVRLIKDGTPKNKECALSVLLELGTNSKPLLVHGLRFGLHEDLSKIAKNGTSRAQRKANSLIKLARKC